MWQPCLHFYDTTNSSTQNKKTFCQQQTVLTKIKWRHTLVQKLHIYALCRREAYQKHTTDTKKPKTKNTKKYRNASQRKICWFE